MSKKKVIFLVGVFGSGKTSAIKRLERQYKNQGVYIYEDDSMLFFLANNNITLRHQFYLHVMYYRIHKGIDDLLKSNASFLIVDGHPLLNLIYGQALLDSKLTGKYSELTKISRSELNKISKAHEQIRNYAKNKGLYQKIEQTVLYVNLPLNENQQLVEKRGRSAIWGDVGSDFLINLRKSLHNVVYQSGILQNIKIIEIKSLEKLESFDPLP